MCAQLVLELMPCCMPHGAAVVGLNFPRSRERVPFKIQNDLLAVEGLRSHGTITDTLRSHYRKFLPKLMKFQPYARMVDRAVVSVARQ